MSTHPSQIHGYTIVEPLTVNPQGGRITYLAEDRDGRRVVLKRFSFAGFDASWAGFEEQRREMQVLRELDHPQIPAYVDWFATDDGPCLVQKWLDKPSISARTSFTTTEIKTIALSLLSVLVYLQDRLPPVIHRDIKPDNVLVDADGTAYLVDFGLARVVTGKASTIAVGTPGFMAPEQMLGRAITPATDLFGVGATLIAMLTGTPSHELGELLDTSLRFDLSRLPRGLHPAFVRWLETMVAPELEDRFPDAQAARQALEGLDIRATSTPARTAASTPARTATSTPAGTAASSRPPASSRAAVTMGLVTIMLVTGLVGFMLFSASSSEPSDMSAPALARRPEPVRIEPEPAPPPVLEPPPPPAKTLECTEEMTLRELPHDLDETLAIAARDGCVLTLEGITISVIDALLVMEGATVTLIDSTIKASRVGLDVRGGRVVLVRSEIDAPIAARVTAGGIVERGPESTLKGETTLESDGWIYGDDPEADAERLRAHRLESYEDGACAGVGSCYRSQSFQGRIKLELRSEIATDGTVSKVRFKGKRPPKAIATCIVEANKAATIPGYVAEDGPGVRICKVDASIQGFMTQWSESRDFELRR